MIKDDFPYFKGKKVYLDSASTTQKPKEVINSVNEYYTNYCSNTHRGSYSDGNMATVKYEECRDVVREFIGAEHRSEVVFTKGCTEGINMVASSFVRDRFKTVIISSLEHHSNIVPWHMSGRTTGNGLEVIRYNKNLEMDLNHFEDLLKKNPGSFVSVTHVSNAFGVIHPVEEIIKISARYGAKVLIDGAQAASRIELDLKELKPDFYTFSGHKCYGPTGVGILYINRAVAEDFSPYQTGGAVIDKVSFSETTLLDSPLKFEAGTQNIAGVIGLSAAIKYIKKIGFRKIDSIESDLKDLIYRELNQISDIELYSDPISTAGNISFNIKGLQPIDLGLLLDKQNIAVRAGHHCTMPIMEQLNIDGTIRISLGLYNDIGDINKFFDSLNRGIEILRA